MKSTKTEIMLRYLANEAPWQLEEAQAPVLEPWTAQSLTDAQIAHELARYQFHEWSAHTRGALDDLHAQMLALLSLAWSADTKTAWGTLVQTRQTLLHAQRVMAPEAADKELVTCGQYSPGFQLNLFGVGHTHLMDPILDLGCGADAGLVKFLHARGHEVVGLDQQAPKEEGMIQASWFEVSLRPAQWGCIMAHQSFALHFVRAHLHQDEQGEQFAHKYRELLHALRPGGMLLYAPGLPFVESFVRPDQYRIRKRKLPEEVHRSWPAALRGLYGMQGPYATIVQRTHA